MTFLIWYFKLLTYFSSDHIQRNIIAKVTKCYWNVIILTVYVIPDMIQTPCDHWKYGSSLIDTKMLTINHLLVDDILYRFTYILIWMWFTLQLIDHYMSTRVKNLKLTIAWRRQAHFQHSDLLFLLKGSADSTMSRWQRTFRYTALVCATLLVATILFLNCAGVSLSFITF